jgi:acyl-CoA synthetase (AMP-forming)/AMP-acid ligase II
VNPWALLERAERDFAERMAVVDGTERRTYRELAERCRALGQLLLERGVGPGDRVAILARNCGDYLVAYYAAAGIGAVLTPLNVRLAASELTAILADSEARLCLVEPALAEAAPPGIAVLPLDGPLAVADRFVPADVRPDDTAQLYYTSGTTGAPKGVMLTHRNVTTHAELTIDALELSSSDVWAHVAPLFHLADAWATFAITAVGGTHVMVRAFDPEAVLRMFAAHRVTITNLIPTMLNLMVKHANARHHDYRSLRCILSGGAPIAPAVVEQVVDLFGCEYVQTYGLTETSPFVTMSLLPPHLRALPPAEQRRYAARTGRPLPGVDVRVVDDEGRPVPCDDRTVGEILVRGPTVTPGYWRKPAETAAAFVDGWLRTGDLAVVDGEGFLQIVDRRKDVILTGGETVYSIEVEQALYRHPAVLEAAVYGMPDPVWGERITAAVALRPGTAATAAELIAFCRQSLAGYKAPKDVRFVDALPRTGSGKISKRLLRGG